MSLNSKPKTATASSGENSGGDFMSSVVAFYFTLLVAPGIYDLTAPGVIDYLVSRYGEGAEDWGVILHGMMVAILTFLGLKKITAIAISMIIAALARYAWRLGFS